MSDRQGLRRRALGVGVVGATVAIWASLAGSAAFAAPPEGSVLYADSADAVASSYIVVMKDGTTASASSLTGKYGGAVGHTYTKAVHGFSATMGATQARRLAADPAVAYVQQNRKVHLADTQPNPPSWGLDRIDQHNLPLDNSYTYATVASTVNAYTIDTGIRITHQTFGGRAHVGFDAVTPGGNANDCHGHGTHVSGTIGGSQYGVAKAVNLFAVRVLDCNGNGTTAGVVAGIDWVTQNAVKPAVANMSLGGGADPTLDQAVVNSINSGVTYGVAAGNGDIFGNPQDACTTSPARVPAAITVSATDINDNKASFANFGTCVDIFAPGVNITSSWNASDTATNTISGTSMATPHVVGAAALVLSGNPTFTPQQVRDKLVADATPDKVINPGPGSPNKLLFTGNTTPPPPNDFSLSASPSSGTVNAGASTTSSVSAAITAGAAQTVNLSASGLPSGATATFNPTSITSGGSASTLTLATSTSTPAGTYQITITGTGAVTHTTMYTLTVNGPGGCPSGQKLGNPGFESGSASWTATSGVIGQWGAQKPTHSGTWNAWLDGYGASHTDTLSQTVTLPAGCANYTLSFWVRIDSAETTGTIAYDKLTVQVGSTTLATYSNLNKGGGYSQKTFNLSAFAGQTVTLKFTGTEDSSLQTSFVIDDTALNVS